MITNGGGYPLDQTFYQTVKGMCTALPALHAGSTMLQVSACGEKLGSQAFTDLMMKWADRWQEFLRHIEAHRDRTDLDQWELQMQAKVLRVIGPEKLWFVSDGISQRVQMHIAVNPVLGRGGAAERAQRAVDDYMAAHPDARVCAIPEGPYTMLRVRS